MIIVNYVLQKRTFKKSIRQEKFCMVRIRICVLVFRIAFRLPLNYVSLTRRSVNEICA